MCFLFASIGILSFYLNSRVRQIGGASGTVLDLARGPEKTLRVGGMRVSKGKSRSVWATLMRFGKICDHSVCASKWTGRWVLEPLMVSLSALAQFRVRSR